ncbi:MAG: hypothetical protein H0W86_09935 [Armatimonadetes bacterium]|nr:hypothetical protein [Armatimonadota bacterium]
MLSLLPFGPKAEATLDLDRIYLRIFHMPGWKLRNIPRADAFIVFTDATGWLGHGTSKYIKDKSDYRLDDQITSLAPIEGGSAVSVAVHRLPARRLVVANPFDQQKMMSGEQYSAAFRAATKEIEAHNGKSFTLFDPTDDWNYQERRVEPMQAARRIVDAILRSRDDGIRSANIIVTNEENLIAYRSLADRMVENQWKFTHEPGAADRGLDLL